MPIPVVIVAIAALAACAVHLPARARILAELGAATLALGHASMVVAYGLRLGATPEPIALASLPSPAARIDAALLLLGSALPIAAALSAWLESGWKALAAVLVTGAVGVGLLVHNAGLTGAVGLIPVAGVALVITAMLALARILWLRLARRPAPAELVTPQYPGTRPVVAWGSIAAGSALALLAPNVLLVLAGAAVAAIGMDVLATRDWRLATIPWRSLVVIGCLGYVGWLLVPIAGTVGLGHSTLAEVPVSSAAAILLVPPIAIAALVLAAPFPLSGSGPRMLLAPVAAALLARVALPLFAGGLDGWRTLLLPAGVLLAWIAAVTGRRASLVAAAAWSAGLAAEATGAAGAMLLALALPLALIAPARARLPHLALRTLAASVAGSGALFALDGLLRVEVFYAVLLWSAWLVLVLREAVPDARVYSRD